MKYYSYRGDEDEVMEWLRNNLDYYQLSLSERSASIIVDGREVTAWGLVTRTNLAYILRDKDAVLFMLKWS
jgi:hypothetical protein